MVRITEELVRKRSEHNEGEISTLEELSLHQENIEKIEHLQQWCQNLTILYFQHNLISKIENMNKLKKLVYLNLAMNNIEVIENLEGCEFLEKLDLTLNFVGEITSVESLKHNRHLSILFLTGNPCVDYDGYQEFVIATLKQLNHLDGQDIKRSMRIEATQKYEHIRNSILIEQKQYKAQRLAQKAKNEEKYKTTCFDDPNDDRPEEEKLKEFWAESCDNSPETRIHMAEQTRRQEIKRDPVEEKKPKRVYKLFTDDGKPRNVNEAQILFHFRDDMDCYELEVCIYKYLDTSLLDVDLHPTYVKVLIKGKVLQLAFPDEIVTSSSQAQRSQITGHLQITMPKLHGIIVPKKVEEQKSKKETITTPVQSSSHRELLEIGSSSSDMDFSKIVERSQQELKEAPLGGARKLVVEEKLPSEDFVENLDVPALE